MSDPIVRHPLSRERSALTLSQDGGADQAHRGQTDINRIMANYVETGAITHVSRREPLYGDFSSAMDLHTATNRVIAAQAHFDGLPSKVRKVADNDPVKFLELTETDEGIAALEAAGLEFREPEILEPNPPLEAEPPPAAPPETPPEEA